MVIDTLMHAPRYEILHPGLKAAFAFLRRPDLASLPVGRHEISGNGVFALVDTGPQRGREAARLEAHRKYIDLRYVIGGTDEIGWRPTRECSRIATPYDPSSDLVFFAEPSAAWITLPPGTFAIFFPEDAHAPLGGSGVLHRIVVKLEVEAGQAP